MRKTILITLGLMFVLGALLTSGGLAPELRMPPPTPGKVVFSEVLPGVPGNNNLEFIELYNAGTQSVDLRGWSVWYRLNETQPPKRLYRWSSTAVIPGFSHLLLTREGQPDAEQADGTFSVPLYERWGGLQLRDAQDQVVDAVGWGKAPQDFFEGEPAATPEEGASLERRPGGLAGNTADTDDNAQDFALRVPPWPQNGGAAAVPALERALRVEAALSPVSVSPGSSFTMVVTVTNDTGRPLSDVLVTIPLPEDVVFESLQTEGDVTDLSTPEDNGGAVTLALPRLGAGESRRLALEARSPWRHGVLRVTGLRVEAAEWPLSAHGPYVTLRVENGAVPIGVAHALVGQEVTVEGVATMFTGGFYAGSTGTKFYLQDDTGGIQVYCPGAKGKVRVGIGDRLQVTGKVEVYRDSLEIVSDTCAEDVQVLGHGEQPPEPLSLTAREAQGGERYAGSLVEVAGTITRFEEFNYSYEVDLLDEAGDTMLVTVEKETGLEPEFLEVGDPYRIVGILEVYDGQWQLKPRLPDDFIRVYPPVLTMAMQGPLSVEAGAPVTYTLTAQNHTTRTLTDVRVRLNYPPHQFVVDKALDPDVTRSEGALLWTLPSLPPEGGSATVTATLRLAPEVTEGHVTVQAEVTAAEWPEPVETDPWMTFIGEGVPIWALQGEGARSPFVGSQATTVGVVTGVFPELEGLWIQSQTPDDNPATSEGIFVWVRGQDLEGLAPGDYVQVTGKVRERSGQTMLDVRTKDALRVLARGQALPEPVELDPPREEALSRAYYESLEGMFVAVSDPVVAVGPTSQYGETPLVRTRWHVTRIMRGEPRGMLIFADDGSSMVHQDRTTLPFALKTGDMLDDLVGPLAFTYENFKIQPITMPVVMTSSVTLPRLSPVGRDDFSVATFNTENFFDILDPHPSSPERPSLRDYKMKLARVATTIELMGAPTVVGLQEVENIGILEDLVAEPTLAPYRYVPILLEGSDSRGIDVGFLVRGDRAHVEGYAQYDAPEGLTSRPPLMITVTVQLEQEERRVILINNHFTSMSGGERATEPRRVAQAQWNAQLVTRILEQDPNALVVVLGDLNSFYRSPPIDKLRACRLHHVYEKVEPDIPYTYIFQGESETLDHILVSDALYAHLDYVSALHTNADFPLPAPDDPRPLHVSDHDPLIAVFDF